MGFHPLNMTRSDLLANFVYEQENLGATAELSEACDMTSTAGYDIDGSIGPDLIDNGIRLGRDATIYSPNATVFFAFGEHDCGTQQCYYQYGKDEEDALRRLREMMERLD